MKLRRFLYYFYAHPYIRWWVGRIRFVILSRVYGIRTLESKDARKNTLSHNLSAFEHIKVDFSMRRMSMLLHAISAVELVNMCSRVLVIGPRTESDILTLYGWGLHNVTGLDLISYSPYILIGDMHDMSFDNDSFDVVICGWTLSYSTSPQRALDEMVRVLKNGGLLAIGVEFMPPLAEEEIESIRISRNHQLIDIEDDRERINSCEQMLEMLGTHVHNVFFRHDAPLRDLSSADLVKHTGLGSSQVMLVVEVRK
jgi:SAM-dependent methyltransferase